MEESKDPGPNPQEVALWIKDMSDEVSSYDPEDLQESPEDDPSIDVRVQYLHGIWYGHSGDSSYDQDHRGHWSNSSVVADMTSDDCLEVAQELVEQILESMAMDEDSDPIVPVLCSCGWGSLGMRESTVPDNCPVCGYCFRPNTEN
jgi:hypothetical protein